MASNGFQVIRRGGLLTGAIIDATGTEMVSSGSTEFGASQTRYYVSLANPRAFAPQERIHAARLDTSVVTVLRRLHLIGDKRHRDEIMAILRRVVVLEEAVVLHLDKRACLAAWRAQEAILRRLSTGDVLRLVAACLTNDVEISEAGTVVCLRLRRHRRTRAIRARTPRQPLLFRKP